MIRSHNIIKSLHSQRGTTAILFVLFLPVLMGVAALAVDLIRLNLIKVELQNAADAAALGGAYSISIPSTGNNYPYNWTEAGTTAKQVAHANYANGAPISISNVTINQGSPKGYWNITTGNFSTTGGTGYVPAIRVTINSGSIDLFFAPFFGIHQSSVQATATAITGAPSGGTGMFPFTMDQTFFNNNWKAGSQKQSVTILSNYPKDRGNGQWSSLRISSEADSYIDGLMKTGNSNYLSIGESIYIANGTMENLYKTAQDYKAPDKVYAVPVVENVDPGTTQKIVAIAAFYIDSIKANGSNSSITGHFIDGYTFPGLTLGDGSGKLYGAFTAPQMAQ
jgi:Flp pilus assembly protein TadG